MPFWKRSEPLHEQLAREGGLLEPEPPPHDTTPRWGAAGIHGVPRPREWDASAVAEAPGLPGDEVSFVLLAENTLIVEGEGDVDPLATALEGQLEPPYRAVAVRRDERFWGVVARQIEVVELPGLSGEEVELSVNDGEQSLRVDGVPGLGRVPPLERLAAERGFDSYVIRAERLDGELFEVSVAPL
jgi:hypothetical protein